MVMKIATYNVNGVNGRLPVLLRWLKEAQPDIVCLQELKAPQEKFPLAGIRKAGYGTSRTARGTSRGSSPRGRATPIRRSSARPEAAGARVNVGH
jgi:exodeoxyribonuclease-3